MDLPLLKFLLDFARDAGLLPVVLFALLLKVYVINGNVDKHFKALASERRLLRRAIRRIDRLAEIHESDLGKQKKEKENVS